MTGQEQEPPREYVDRDSHSVWGKRYLLKVVEKDAALAVHLKHNRVVLQVRLATAEEKGGDSRRMYRAQLKDAILAAELQLIYAHQLGK